MKTARQVEDIVRAEWPDGGTIRARKHGNRWTLSSEKFRKDGTRIGYWAEAVVSADSPDALIEAFRAWLKSNAEVAQ
jgi:hypothetical protein